jgi:hypothetical protein
MSLPAVPCERRDDVGAEFVARGDLPPAIGDVGGE